MSTRAEWQVAKNYLHTAYLPNPGTYQILMVLYWYNKTKIENQSKCKWKMGNITGIQKSFIYHL